MALFNRTGLQNSGTDTQLKRVLLHLHLASATEDKPVCQNCNKTIKEGEQVTLYLYKPAGSSRFRVGQSRCCNHNEDLTTLFTLGVDELIIDGRIGRCSDQATQQSWPILLEPRLRLVSSASTTTAREITTQSDNRDDPDEPLTVDIPQSTVYHHWGQGTTGDDTAKPQAATLDRWKQQPTDTEGDC